MSKKGIMDKSKIISILVLVAMIGGFIYAISAGGYGVVVSCDSKEIIGIKKVPPPLMMIAQPTYCSIDLEVKNGTETICSITDYKVHSETEVVPCSELKSQKGNEQLDIKVTFYHEDEQPIVKTIKSEELWE